MANKRQQIVFPREVLLVEIERHCAGAYCNARKRIGLTKEEARLYDGFECDVCEQWQEDGLTERDIPDWWEELTITGLDALRARQPSAGAPEINETGAANDADNGVVARLSEAWQSAGRRGERGGIKDAPDDGGDR
jgi:hypothetical protein